MSRVLGWAQSWRIGLAQSLAASTGTHSGAINRDLATEPGPPNPNFGPTLGGMAIKLNFVLFISR